MANLNLRKALKIKKQLESFLAKPVSSSLEIDLDDPQVVDINGYLNKAETSFLTAVEERVRLSHILSEVRRQVEENNARGVNAILSQVAHIDRQIALFKKVSDLHPVDQNLLASKIERKRDQAKNQTASHGYFGEDTTITATPVSKETVASFKTRIAELRRKKEALEDKRLALNSNAELSIEIADDDIEFLKGFDIV